MMDGGVASLPLLLVVSVVIVGAAVAACSKAKRSQSQGLKLQQQPQPSVLPTQPTQPTHSTHTTESLQALEAQGWMVLRRREKLHCPWREAERGPDPYEEALKVGQDDKYERTGQTDIELRDHKCDSQCEDWIPLQVFGWREEREADKKEDAEPLIRSRPKKENKERLELIDKGELIEDDKKADTLEVVDSVAECKQAEVFMAKSRTRTETQTETSGTITDQALNRKSDKNIQRKEKCRIHGKIHKNGCSAGEKTRGSTVDREDSGTGPERRTEETRPEYYRKRRDSRGRRRRDTTKTEGSR